MLENDDALGGIFDETDPDIGPLLMWEVIPATSADTHTTPGKCRRARVPGGWLVCVTNTAIGMGLTFVPDHEHNWVI